jgi:low temperature requirement protein LtrA
VVVGVHTGLYSRTSVTHTIRSLLRLAPFNLLSALLVLAAVVAGGTAGYLLWAAAFVLEWVTPLVTRIGGFRVAPAHFVERHGLVVLIALGESVVAIGIGAADLPLDLGLAAVAVLGLLLAACLWWAYFGGDDARAERALAGTAEDRRAAVAVRAFDYWHLPILLGIVCLAAGLKDAIGHAYDRLDPAHAWLLAGGAAVFLAGDVGFRHTLRLGPGRLRAAAAALALATVPLGVAASALLQLSVLGIVLSGSLAFESAGTWSRGGSSRPSSPSNPAS